MGFLDIFKGSGTSPTPIPSEAKNPYLEKILKSLNDMPEDQAKYLAAFAYILGRVAHVDLEVSEEETQKMEEIVEGLGNLTPDVAQLIVQIAKSHNALFGGTDNYLIVREFKKIGDRKQKEELLHCLFGVAGADENISLLESDEIRMISKELGFSHPEFTEIKLHYREKLAILKNLP